VLKGSFAPEVGEDLIAEQIRASLLRCLRGGSSCEDINASASTPVPWRDIALEGIAIGAIWNSRRKITARSDGETPHRASKLFL